VRCNSGVGAGHDVGVEVDERRWRLEVLYREHADEVFAFVRRRAGASVAEDVLMEVFVVACRRLDDVPERPLPWLLGCARRILANQRRAEMRADALTLRLSETAAARGLDERAADVLGAAMTELRSADQEILLLSSWEGLGAAELASVLGCSRAAAAVRLHRARQRLRAALARVLAGPDGAKAVEVIR
jgi:RNA polymerase sigma-70 factor, ECF subfamily